MPEYIIGNSSVYTEHMKKRQRKLCSQ